MLSCCMDLCHAAFIWDSKTFWQIWVPESKQIEIQSRYNFFLLLSSWRMELFVPGLILVYDSLESVAKRCLHSHHWITYIKMTIVGKSLSWKWEWTQSVHINRGWLQFGVLHFLLWIILNYCLAYIPSPFSFNFLRS